MAGVAQLVRAPDCGSGGRGFGPHHSPQSCQHWPDSFAFSSILDRLRPITCHVTLWLNLTDMT